MVCLSGGKDSYTLLDMLLSLQRSAPVSFELIAVNLDQKQPGFPADVLPRLSRGSRRAVPHHRAEHLRRGEARHSGGQDDVRPVLAPAARRAVPIAAENGITKIALGHHRDDIVETLFLNMFFGGRLKAMPPKLLSEDRRHIVIRPLPTWRRRLSRAMRRRGSFPSFPARCAARRPNMQRLVVKNMLRKWEQEFPGRIEAIFSSICNVSAPSSPTRRCSTSPALRHGALRR